MNNDQIVTCSGLDCSVCSVLEVVSNLFRYLMGISAVIATTLLILAGFLFILNLGKTKELNKAKTIFKFAIFGFIVTLVSFLVIYTLYQVSGAKNPTGWYQIQCGNDGVSESSDSSGTTYLSPSESNVVATGSLSAIATGDKNVVSLNARELNPDSVIADINTMDPDRKINFVTVPEDLGTQYLIDYRNLVLGYKVDSKEDFSNVDDLFTVNTTDASGQYVIEPKGKLKTILGDKIFATKDNLETIIQAVKKVAQVNGLGNKEIIAYTSGDSLGNMDACVDSGGQIIDFKNDCLRDKEKYNNRNNTCTSKSNPVSGCDCPSGFYLDSGGRCASSGEIEKGETVKSCADVFLEQKNCPVSRCEGDQMMNYPSSVKDECTTDSSGNPTVKRVSCTGMVSTNSSENQKCAEQLNSLSQQEQLQQAHDYYNKNKQSPDWYDKILQDQFGKGSDVQQGGKNGTSGTGTGSDTGTTGTGTDTGTDTTGTTGTGPTDTGPLPQDQGAGNFNPTPKFKELKECIGLKDDQIPYNGLLVVLLNPIDPLNKSHYENISKMFYLSRNGEVIGKNGEDLGKSPMAGGQEYGARDFSKGASNNSMWGRGWKIFKGPTKYNKGGWTDHCSYGSHDGYKTGSSGDALNQANLRGGKVSSMSRCGQHVGFKNSSAGCATMGNKSRCGFIDKSKSYMTQSNGTIMQINFIGAMDSSGKFSSPDCGKIDYCSAKKSFEQNSGSRQFKNNPNEGYQQGDKRWVQC